MSGNKVDEETTCQDCRDTYTKPRKLHCNHVFCTGCLEERVKVEVFQARGTSEDAEVKSIKCIVCKERTFLLPEGVQVLPVDKKLSLIVDRKYSDDGRLLCNCCIKLNEAKARCFDCGYWICSVGCDAHRSMYDLQSHEVERRFSTN